MNDAVESRAVLSVFGKPEAQPHVWASKPVTGHALGVSSLFQVVLTLRALAGSVVPRTFHCTEPDPACGVRLNLTSPVSTPLRRGLCLTSGFWGNCSSIVVSHGNAA